MGCVIIAWHCADLFRIYGAYSFEERMLVEKSVVSICPIFNVGICRGVVFVKKVRGSATVELTYMMPIIFLAFITTIYIIFYFHDKNILIGAAYETAVVGGAESAMG